MNARTAIVAALATLGPTTAAAVCVSDTSGTSFVNPDDPSCRNAMFTYTQNDNAGTNIALGYAVPMPVDSLTGVDGFRRYDSLFARHQDLALTTDTVDGVVVGQTRSGRDIWAYRVGDADATRPDGTPEAAVMLNGTTHAREWQSPEGVTEVLEQLAEMATDGGFGQFLAENLTVVILPVLNVDGFLSTQAFPDRVGGLAQQPREGRMRRKNLSHPSTGGAIDDDIDTTDDNFFGVDLNRNSVHGFGLNQASLSDIHSLVYRGPSAGSEPEIAALLAAAALGPANRLRLYTDLHSFSQIFFTPQTGNARRDNLTQGLATRMRAVTGNKYRWGPDPAGSGGIGTTADYFAYQFEIPSWTLETEPLTGGADYGGTGVSHSGFVLPASEVARMRDELASMLLLGFYRQAGPPSVTGVRIDRVDDGSTAYAATWGVGPGGTTRMLNRTADTALEAGVEYALWLSFDKPMRYRNAAGSIVAYPGQGIAGFPEIVVALPNLGADGTEIAVDDATMAWLDAPGGAPSGYARYRDDALSARFTLPSSLDLSTQQPVIVQVDARDLSQLSVDGDPSTPVDWSGGHWTGYEDAFGIDGDTGDADCSFRPWAGDPAAAPPADRSSPCPAATAAPPPPPPPAPPPPPPALFNGGGGGATGAALVLAVAVALIRRRDR